MGIQRIPLDTLQSEQIDGDTGVFLTLFFFFLPPRLRLCRTAASCNSVAHSCGSCPSPARFFFPKQQKFFSLKKQDIKNQGWFFFVFYSRNFIYIYIKSAKRCFDFFL